MKIRVGWQIFLLIFLLLGILGFLAVRNEKFVKQLPPPTQLEEEIPSISQTELSRGWYFGTDLQKKPGTPANWIYTEAGRSSCWHEPELQCRF
ncbi:MAG: hypothetical protein ACD_61C00282G0002 [uncultured bacterium]|nr:MAG: hypothetical protein ACD_61C00282G0002 [uncultured bacterium]